MSNKSVTKINGVIDAVFAHRFVVITEDRRKRLADLGPQGVERFPLEIGAEVWLEGESKPSELKVTSIATPGHAPVEIEHKKPKHDDEGDPKAARKAVEGAGFAVLGEPRRKPKHFEVLGRKGGQYTECHVEFDSTIRKEKPVESGDEKWAAELKSAA